MKELLMNDFKYSLEDAESAIKTMIEKQEYPPELLKAFEQMK
jgi:hypothetical protein